MPVRRLKGIFVLLLTTILPCLELPAATADQASIRLAGTWSFQLDPDNAGVTRKWYAGKLEDSVTLPGTTDENHKGIARDERPTDSLMRQWFWKGPAWYQREIDIPESWAGKRISLFLERSKNTRIWVDQTFCGREDTLSAPQIFDLSETMTPGRHTLTLLIDNSKLPPVGPAHAIDERTQTNWNGVIGRMELLATDPVWIEDVQVYPQAAQKLAHVRVTVGNATGKSATGKIDLTCQSRNVATPADFRPQTVKVEASAERTVIEFIYHPGGEVPLWDEFHPALLRLDLRLQATAGGAAFTHGRSVTFGMRDFTHDGGRLLINGRPVFLRGRLDCANYPLTGHPPMDKAEWLRILGILKDWGLNHVRFHTWCPPEAAFEAADELGLYLQPELPNKRSAFNAPESDKAAVHNIDNIDVASTETGVSLFDYGKREGELIFRHFGNHPSFVMFTLGNELDRNKGMVELVSRFKQLDPRHLYAQGSNDVHWDPSFADGDEFWITGKVEKSSKPLRGSFSILDFPNPHIESFPPSTMVDYHKSIEGQPVPMIAHEVGQFQVFPDFRDIPKFTGVLRARNYEIFQERLKEAGMLDEAHDFVRASGALSAICYREDIEAALRTPGFGGFQLLDIMDFPGQGTALVGMLNVFMESKGVIEPEQWRMFCSEVVPLLRMGKYVWTSDETSTGKVQIAHYGPADIPDAHVTVTVTDPQAPKDAHVASFTFAPTTLRRGGLVDVGDYSLDLNSAGVHAPRKLIVTLAIEGTHYRNSYPIWVYPPKVDTRAADGILVTRSFADAKTRKHLADGGKVLLLPELGKLPQSIEGGFQSQFWSPMFDEAARKHGTKETPGTLGILCNPESPALAAFPTDFHSDWQWWQLVKNSRPLILDDTPPGYRPIVQVIDNFARNHKLGLICESKVGKGKMLICSIDLPALQDRPEGRQMLHSLLRYLDSKDFDPQAEIDIAWLNKWFPG